MSIQETINNILNETLISNGVCGPSQASLGGVLQPALMTLRNEILEDCATIVENAATTEEAATFIRAAKD